ncbi:MAG TPA: DUF1573 domain-containing protein, partial [Anaeromyxobacteraceae bacterium]|nr:DUF1573 domain-containing protein [Anaeromyxobacteraceae bacterium]
DAAPPRPMPATLALLVAALLPAATPGAPAPASAHDFGEVVGGRPVEHVFRVASPGAAPARITRVVLTPPLVVSRLPASIPAGGDVALPVRLDTTKVEGAFEGRIAVFLEGVDEPIALGLRGTIVRPVEIAPRPFVVLGAIRGDEKESSVELVSHEAEPFRVERIESASQRLTTRLETVEPGRRYRLHVALRRDAPAGRAHERILVHTSSSAAPLLHVGALVNVHERVYTFPDAVDLGAIRAAELARDPDAPARLAQTLMVYQAGGTRFDARFRSAVPGLTVTAERGPNGDRWQATVRLSGPRAPGPISGTIVVETNDPAVPRLEVPVTGTILD